MSNKITTKLSLDLQGDMLREIDALAKIGQRSRSAQIRLMLETQLRTVREAIRGND